MAAEGIRAALLVPAALAPAAVAMARHVGRGLRPTERLLVALALAPFALGIAVLGAALIRLPLPAAFGLAEFLWIVAALWPPGARRAPEHASPMPERGLGFPAVAVLTVTAAIVVLVAIPLTIHPYVRMRGDAWFPSAVAIEIARHGVPPQDPYVAGLPLARDWFFPLLVAALAAVSRSSSFHAQAMLDVWAAALAALATAHLAYRLWGRTAATIAGPIAVLGMNPLGWLRWLPAAIGIAPGPTGWDRLRDGDRALAAVSYGFPPAHASLLAPFWGGGALPLAIALSASLAWSLARSLATDERGGTRRSFLIACAVAAVDPAFAIPGFAALAVGLLPIAAAPGRRGAAAAGALALAAAALIGIAVVRASTPPGGFAPARSGLDASHLLSLALAIGPWWLIAAPALAWAARGSPAQRFGVGALAVAALAALVLPGGSGQPALFLAWILVAPFAAAGLDSWAGRWGWSGRARAVLVAALVLPTSLLCAIGFVRDDRSPRALLADRGIVVGPAVASADELVAYRFLEAQRGDAVIIESPRPAGNEPVPVLAGRRLFCGATAAGVGPAQLSGPKAAALREELEVRRGIQRALFAGGELDEAQRLYLDSFTQPLLLLVRANEHPADLAVALGRTPRWIPVFTNPTMAIFRYDPTAHE